MWAIVEMTTLPWNRPAGKLKIHRAPYGYHMHVTDAGKDTATARIIATGHITATALLTLIVLLMQRSTTRGLHFLHAQPNLI